MSDSNREWGPQSRGYKPIKQSVTIDAQDYDNLLWEFELLKNRHAALVEAAKDLLSIVELVDCDCEHFHHAKKDRHGSDMPCPLESRMLMARISLRKALEASGE